MRVENLNPLKRMGIMNKFLMMSAMVLSVAAVPVLAQPGDEGGRKDRAEKRMEKMFEKNDSDKDGSISKEEFTASAEKRFSDMDKDGDGSVSKDEAKEHAEKMHEKWKENKEKLKEGKTEEMPPAEGEIPPPAGE